MSEKDVRRVAAESGLDARTVRRYFGGSRPRSLATVNAIEAACVRLRLDWKEAEQKQVQKKEERT